MSKLILNLFKMFLLFFSTFTFANDGGCKTLVSKNINKLPHKIESYPFRIWYATEGEHALKDSTVNPAVNNIPVIINDLLLQLHTADKYYSQELGLTPPLSQQRYKQAELIDVSLIAMKKGNGLAFDEVISGKNSQGIEHHPCGIKIHINSALQPSHNITPAHELFHLYQYSNSMFKASWYLEGMTRWVEKAFLGAHKREPDSHLKISCSDVNKESYTASRYWQNLSKRKAAKDIKINKEYLDIKYSNGKPVFQTDTFINGSSVKYFFDVLKKESANQSVINNLPEYRWPERIQRSFRFDKDMCRAVESINVL